jgi:nucleoside-diphosphate kinase
MLAFYSVHAARPFYGELVEFMSRGAIVVAILEKTTLLDFRTLIGATRMMLKVHNKVKLPIGENAVHGSDSDENAAIEGASICMEERAVDLSL